MPPPYIALGRLQVTLCGQGRFFVFNAGDQMRGNSVHLKLEDTASFPPACTCGFFDRFGMRAAISSPWAYVSAPVRLVTDAILSTTFTCR